MSTNIEHDPRMRPSTAERCANSRHRHRHQAKTSLVLLNPCPKSQTPKNYHDSDEFRNTQPNIDTGFHTVRGHSFRLRPARSTDHPCPIELLTTHRASPQALKKPPSCISCTPSTALASVSIPSRRSSRARSPNRHTLRASRQMTSTPDIGLRSRRDMDCF